MRRFNVASVPGRLLLAVLAVACLTGAWHLMATGLNQLAQARQMERMPQTPVAALVKGPYAISGQVKTGRENLTTPYSASSAVYVRYRLQEEYRDADGERRTRTLEAGEQGIPFLLGDDTGTVAIAPGQQLRAINWNLSRTYHRQTGARIYSEWALQPGDTVRVIGQYHPDRQQMEFSGLDAFTLPALVSARHLAANSGDRLFAAAIRISGAAGLLALGLALLLTAAKVHRFWVYVLTLSVVITGTLWTLGIARLNQEWTAIAALYETRYQQLGTPGINPRVEADVAALHQLIQRSTDGWLDHWMFRRVVEDRLPAPELDAHTATLAQQMVDSQPGGHYAHTWKSLALSGGSALLALALLFFAIRTLKFKRLIEAIPTSSSRGLSFGLAELKGLVDVDDRHPPVRDPLRNQKCVAYDYKVEERRGSDSDDKWRTVEHRSERVPFWLEDNHGRIRVHPEGATIEYPKHHSEIRGDRRFTVRLLEPLVNVYCLGFAGLDREQPDRLTLQQDHGSPFLISARDEDELVRSRGAGSFVGTAVALGLFLFAATAVFAADGNFSPDNLLLAALAIPLVLSIYSGILHYNDIVFLKHRVDRAAANIDTILQQRHDLWPNLEEVVKATLGHEKPLLKAIARLRSIDPARISATGKLDKLIGFERRVTRTLQARVENNPELNSNEIIRQFITIMADTENYLALLRNSYTESAQVYNTRIQSFPDLILARLFRFRAVPAASRTAE